MYICGSPQSGNNSSKSHICPASSAALRAERAGWWGQGRPSTQGHNQRQTPLFCPSSLRSPGCASQAALPMAEDHPEGTQEFFPPPTGAETGKNEKQGFQLIPAASVQSSIIHNMQGVEASPVSPDQ